MDKRNSHKSILLLLLLVVPVVASVLLGFQMRAGVIEAVPTVVVDHDGTDFSGTLTNYITDNHKFDVRAVLQEDAAAERMLATGEAVIAVIFPENMYRDMRKGGSPTVLVFYDTSQLHMIAFSKTTMTQLLLTAQAGYMQSVYEGKLNMPESLAANYLLPIRVEYTSLFNPSQNMRNYVLAGMLTALMQICIALVGVVTARTARENRLLRVPHAIAQIFGYGLLGTLSLLLCLGIQILFFDMPYKGSVTAGLLLTWLFATALTAFGYFIATLIKDKVFAVQICSVLVLPTSLLGGYTYPAFAMPPLMEKAAALMPFSYYSTALRNLSQIELPASYVGRDCVFLLLFLAAFVLLSMLLLSLPRPKQRPAGRLQAFRDLIMLRIKPCFILAFIPFVFTLIFGYAFSPVYVQDIPTVVWDADRSPLSAEVAENLDATPGLAIVDYVDSAAEIQDAMYSEKAYAALVLPESFGAGVAAGENPGAAVYVNNINFLVGNNAMLHLANVFNDMNASLRIEALERGGIATGAAEAIGNTLSCTDRMLYNPSASYLHFFLPGIICIVIQQTFLVCLTVLLVDDRERLLPGKTPLRGSGLTPHLLYTWLAFLCSSLTGFGASLLALDLAFGFSLPSSPATALLSCLLFLLGLSGIALVVSSLSRDAAHCAQFIVLLAVPTLLTSGYVWPEYMMPPGFGTGVKLLWPLWYFAAPLKSMVLKGFGAAEMAPHLSGAVLFAAFWLLLGLSLYAYSLKRKQGIGGI